MKKTFIFIAGFVVAVAVLAGLVHAVLVAAQISEPSVDTVHGLTPRRLWATTASLLGLVGVVLGGLAFIRPSGRFRVGLGRFGGSVALVAGSLAALNGGLNLTLADGGPGSGNGVVGGAAALVLGLIALILGTVSLMRGRRAPAVGRNA